MTRGNCCTHAESLSSPPRNSLGKQSQLSGAQRVFLSAGTQPQLHSTPSLQIDALSYFIEALLIGRVLVSGA